MFKEAIRNNITNIKPLVTGYKKPFSDGIINSIGTVIVLNEDGWVLTCKHLADTIVIADQIMNKYEDIKKELFENKIPPKKIYKKYDIKDDQALIMQNVFLNLIEKWDSIRIFAHEYLDLALIKFENPGKIMCDKYPIFAKENASIGEYLCRIGFPYPEINCFRYNHVTKTICVKEDFNSNIQPFPLDGMVTRYLLDNKGNNTLFEMTNPILLGQDGGSILNKDGYIVGMQAGSVSRDTYLDIDTDLIRNNSTVHAKQYNFINFGIGINVDTIKKFLDEHDVKYKIEK